MTILAGKDLSALIDQGVVESMIDLKAQYQMCGVELTLQKIERFISSGSVAFDNAERRLPQVEGVSFDDSGWADLEMGAYLVTFNEIVSIPRDVTAIARPRSSLLRCGASIETALWDPGYRGRSQSLLVVHNPAGLRLKKDARLMQLIFVKLSEDADKIYSGTYQGENMGRPTTTP